MSLLCCYLLICFSCKDSLYSRIRPFQINTDYHTRQLEIKKNVNTHDLVCLHISYSEICVISRLKLVTYGSLLVCLENPRDRLCSLVAERRAYQGQKVGCPKKNLNIFYYCMHRNSLLEVKICIFSF